MDGLIKLKSVILSLIIIFSCFSTSVFANGEAAPSGTAATDVKYEDWKEQAKKDANGLSAADITAHVNEEDFKVSYINKIQDPTKVQAVLEAMDSKKFALYTQGADPIQLQQQLNKVSDWSKVPDENVAQINSIEVLAGGAEPTITRMGNRISALNQKTFEDSIKKLTNTQSSPYSYDVSGSKKSSVGKVGEKWVITIEGRTLEPSNKFAEGITGWIAVDDPAHFRAVMDEEDPSVKAGIEEAVRILQNTELGKKATAGQPLTPQEQETLNYLKEELQRTIDEANQNINLNVPVYADSIKALNDGSLELTGNQVVVIGHLKNFKVKNNGNLIADVVENREGSFEVEGFNIKADDAEAYTPTDYFDGGFIRTITDDKADIETLPLAGRQTVYVDLTDPDNLIGGETSGRKVRWHKEQQSPDSIFFRGEIPKEVKDKTQKAKENIPKAQSEEGEVWIKREKDNLFIYSTGAVQLSSYHYEGEKPVKDTNPKFRFVGVGADSKLDSLTNKQLERTESYAYGRFIYEDRNTAYDSSQFKGENPEMISLIISGDGGAEKVRIDGPEGSFMRYTQKGQIKHWISEEQMLVNAEDKLGNYVIELKKEDGKIKYLPSASLVGKELKENEFLVINKITMMELDDQEDYLAIEQNGIIAYEQSDGEGKLKGTIISDSKSVRFALGQNLVSVTDEQERVYNKLVGGDYGLSNEELKTLKDSEKLRGHILETSGIVVDRLTDAAYINKIKESDEGIKKSAEIDEQAKIIQQQLIDNGIINTDGSLKDGLTETMQNQLNELKVKRYEAQKQRVDATISRLQAGGIDTTDLEFNSKLISMNIDYTEGRVGGIIRDGLDLLAEAKGDKEKEKEVRYLLGLSYLEAARRAPNLYPNGAQLARINFEKVADLDPDSSEGQTAKEIMREIDISTLSMIGKALGEEQGAAIERIENKLGLKRKLGGVFTRGVSESLLGLFGGGAMYETAIYQEEGLSEQAKGVILIKGLMKQKNPATDEYYTLNEIRQLKKRQMAELFKLEIDSTNKEEKDRAVKAAVEMTSAIGTAFNNPDMEVLAKGGRGSYQFGNYLGDEERAWYDVGLDVTKHINALNVALFLAPGATVGRGTVMTYIGVGIKTIPGATTAGGAIIKQIPTFQKMGSALVRERAVPGLWKLTERGRAIKINNLALKAQELYNTGKTTEAAKAYAEASKLLKETTVPGASLNLAAEASSESIAALLKESKAVHEAAVQSAQAAKAQSFWRKERSTWNGVKSLAQKTGELGGSIRTSLENINLNGLKAQREAANIKLTQLRQEAPVLKVAEQKGKEMGIELKGKAATYTNDAGGVIKGDIEQVVASEGKLSKITLKSAEGKLIVIEGEANLGRLTVGTTSEEIVQLEKTIAQLGAEIKGAEQAQAARATIIAKAKAAQGVDKAKLPQAEAKAGAAEVKRAAPTAAGAEAAAPKSLGTVRDYNLLTKQQVDDLVKGLSPQEKKFLKAMSTQTPKYVQSELTLESQGAAITRDDVIAYLKMAEKDPSVFSLTQDRMLTTISREIETTITDIATGKLVKITEENWMRYGRRGRYVDARDTLGGKISGFADNVPEVKVMGETLPEFVAPLNEHLSALKNTKLTGQQKYELLPLERKQAVNDFVMGGGSFDDAIAAEAARTQNLIDYAPKLFAQKAASTPKPTTPVADSIKTFKTSAEERLKEFGFGDKAAKEAAGRAGNDADDIIRAWQKDKEASARFLNLDGTLTREGIIKLKVDMRSKIGGTVAGKGTPGFTQPVREEITGLFDDAFKPKVPKALLKIQPEPVIGPAYKGTGIIYPPSLLRAYREGYLGALMLPYIDLETGDTTPIEVTPIPTDDITADQFNIRIPTEPAEEEQEAPERNEDEFEVKVDEKGEVKEVVDVKKRTLVTEPEKLKAIQVILTQYYTTPVSYYDYCDSIGGSCEKECGEDEETFSHTDCAETFLVCCL